jgi:hypothetical protein
VDVAITGVEDVDDADAVTRADFGDLLQNERQLCARHHAILCAIARAQSADRAERLLAAFPELQAFLRVVRHPHFASAAFTTQGDDLVALRVESRFKAIDFDEQPPRRRRAGSRNETLPRRRQ